MSRHYKKLVLILISACAGFCLALSFGSAEEAPQLTEESCKSCHIRLNWDPNYKRHLPSEDLWNHFATIALYSLDARGWLSSELYNYWDPNYIHHLPSRDTPLTLDETRLLYQSFVRDNESVGFEIIDIIGEGDKVAVRCNRWSGPPPGPRAGSDWSCYHLFSEIWILRIADDKIVEGWSVAEPGPDFRSQEEKNKTLVREAILAFDEDPYDANLPEQFDPNYVQHGPDTFPQEVPRPHNAITEWLGGFIPTSVIFHYIIAEGDMVSVLFFYSYEGLDWPAPETYCMELATYRIAGGKIVEGWIAIGLTPYNYPH